MSSLSSLPEKHKHQTTTLEETKKEWPEKNPTNEVETKDYSGEEK